MLEEFIKQKKQDKPILLMTHLVMGYPSFDENEKLIKAMVEAGVELIELQIPFSEPTADGPVILKANSLSLQNGTNVQHCMEFAGRMCETYPEVSFLFMTYYNIVFVFGQEAFVSKSREIGIKGFIIPDLPPEEASEWLNLCEKHSLDSIFIYTPTHTRERLEYINESAQGFIYCVGRRGVTGNKTSFDQSMSDLIAKYRGATKLPLALGFGIQSKEDVDFLIDKVDIAVIGTQVIKIHESSGTNEVQQFLTNIRSN